MLCEEQIMVIKSFLLAWLSLKLVNKGGSHISACCGDAAKCVRKNSSLSRRSSELKGCPERKRV